jgi:hypothetical protein
MRDPQKRCRGTRRAPVPVAPRGFVAAVLPSTSWGVVLRTMLRSLIQVVYQPVVTRLVPSR